MDSSGEPVSKNRVKVFTLGRLEYILISGAPTYLGQSLRKRRGFTAEGAEKGQEKQPPNTGSIGQRLRRSRIRRVLPEMVR